MAVPIFNETGNMTLVADADTVQWPIATEVDTDIKVQGTASNADAIRNGGTFTYTFGTAQDMSATNTMIRAWFQYTFASTLNLTSAGGIQLGITDGSNAAYWYVSGSDLHKGTWELLQADISATPDTGTTPNLSSITAMYIVLTNATSARNVNNTFIDISWYGTGIEFYGGTTVDKVTWNTLAVADTGATTSKQYGIIELIKGGAYYLNHAMFIGDSAATNNCYFDGAGETVVFYSANEKSGAYQIKATGNATGTTDINLDGASILSSSTPFVFDMSSANLTTLSMSGAKLKNASVSTFKTGQTITGVTFDSCGTILPSGATLDSCAILNCNTASSVLTASLTETSTCDFISDGSNHAVELTSIGAGSMTWDNTTSGYDIGATGSPITPTNTGNEALYVNVGSGTLTVNVAAGATTPSIRSAGATVNVVAGQVTITFNVSPAVTGYEYAIYTVTALGSLAGAVEVQHVEVHNSSSFQYTYTYSAGVVIAVQVISAPASPLDYEESITYYTLGPADSSQTITLTKDENN